ncbi:hypothetical protein SAMN05892877_11427 [Rhizobium subbaraonis]|uniref:Uncharacterized protein n=1 Tax=Rhizobium subbaraonis TaxID=908946 RepID=A0A285UTM6_9HYPH|nr:hypothetical protein [Rhizobium subbaraonis]SOC45153.1 hypothetical protein SAMN05892877_11427 [Rhizobium subbaraonis]
MPRLVRFLGVHVLIGFSIATALVFLLVMLDVAGLRTLAKASASGPMTIACLALVLGLTFASVQMGFAIMLLGRQAKSDRGLKDRSVKAVIVDPVRLIVRK